MTTHPARHHCVVCSCLLPPMTRDEAFQKGAAFEYRGKTYYRCAGRHAHDECIRIIEATPTFTRARKAEAL